MIFDACAASPASSPTPATPCPDPAAPRHHRVTRSAAQTAPQLPARAKINSSAHPSEPLESGTPSSGSSPLLTQNRMGRGLYFRAPRLGEGVWAPRRLFCGDRGGQSGRTTHAALMFPPAAAPGTRGDVGLLGRSRPPQVLCAVFSGCPQQLNRQLFKRAFSRAALVLAPEQAWSELPGEAGTFAEGVTERKLMSFLRALADSASGLKLPVLDIRRRVHALQALDKLSATVRALKEEKQVV
eukprot:scaffold14251_cov114-Isochrysis_galbana.AAC.3